MNFFKRVAKAIDDAADQGEDVAKHVFKQLLENPELAVLGPIGLGIGAVQNLARGRNVFGGGGVGGAHRQPPLPGSVGGTGKLAGLLHTALGAGKTIAGTQPYTVTSFAGIASGTAVTENGDITDMFGSAQCTAFTTNDTFPWPFQSYRMRWSISTLGGQTVAGGAVAQTGDPTWINTLHAVFSNATEIARIGLTNLGLRTHLLPIYNAATVGVSDAFYSTDAQPGVLWPVYYEKNGSYAMIVRTDHPCTTTAGIQISMQLDGWVINDPTLINAGYQQIQATADALMQGSFGESALVSLLKN